MARKRKTAVKARGYKAGYINPDLVKHQFQAKTPSDWSFSTKSDVLQMSMTELRKKARQMAKQSNQRLVRLEQQGLTNTYQYQTTMTYLSGANESPDSQKRGYASFASKTGRRFKENVDKLERNELISLIQNATFHLNRKSTVGQQRKYYDTHIDGMREAVERSLMERDSEYRYGMSKYILTDEEIVAIFESTQYKELSKHGGYRTAVQQIVKQLDYDNLMQSMQEDTSDSDDWMFE